MNEGLEPKLPLIYSEADGPYGMLTNEVYMINQNLKNLLLTSPGERIMDPFFGIGIKAFLFEHQADLDASFIQEETRRQVSRYIQGISIVEMLFSQKEEEIIISIKYRFNINKSNTLMYSFSVSSN